LPSQKKGVGFFKKVARDVKKPEKAGRKKDAPGPTKKKSTALHFAGGGKSSPRSESPKERRETGKKNVRDAIRKKISAGTIRKNSPGPFGGKDERLRKKTQYRKDPGGKNLLEREEGTSTAPIKKREEGREPKGTRNYRLMKGEGTASLPAKKRDFTCDRIQKQKKTLKNTPSISLGERGANQIKREKENNAFDARKREREQGKNVEPCCYRRGTHTADKGECDGTMGKQKGATLAYKRNGDPGACGGGGGTRRSGIPKGVRIRGGVS